MGASPARQGSLFAFVLEAGEGRKGTALAFSLILRPTAEEKPHLSRTVGLAALAVADTLRTRGLISQIKWPNDVLLNGRKVAGILVEGIFDVIYLKDAEIKTIPTAVHLRQDEYLQGTAFYQDKMMSILNVKKIISQGELIINEEV